MSIDKSAKILIVDDYNTMRRIIGSLLRQLDLSNVTEAENGQEALSKLKNEKFDLVISDWNMQPMSGLDLLKAVRSDDDLKKLPFIMVTAESKTENVVEAKQAGVSNYLVKPFNAETLKRKLSSVFGPW